MLDGEGQVNNFLVMAGSEVFFNSSIGMQIMLGYTIQKSSINNQQWGYEDTKKGFQPTIGFQIHLEK